MNKHYFISIIVLSLFGLILLQEGVGNKTCEYEMIDNVKYDLSKLRKETIDYTNIIGRYTYKANFCGPLVNKCVTLPDTPAAMFLRGNACLNRYTTQWKPHTEYIDPLIKSKGIKLSFPEGDKCYLGVGNHKLTYILSCDKNIEVQFERIEKVTTCTIEYHFMTKYACLEFAISSSWNYLNSKTILAIMVVLIAWYFIGFTYYNMKSNPDEGLIKNLPHREFWSNFCEYASLGISTTLSFINSKLSKDNTSAYGNI